MKNLLVGQSGGPTAVINASLGGVISAASLHPQEIGRIYGMRNGIEGFLKGNIIDLTGMSGKDVNRLEYTPGAYLGSCRYRLPADLQDPVYSQLFEKFQELDIGYVFYIGGNDSMDTVSRLSRHAAAIGSDIRFIGIPKTIDNDLILTDHTPGFGSAARFVASTVREICLDAAVYDIPAVTIVEIMGRNAGWLTAASALARKFPVDNPSLICFPELDFDQEDFVEKVQGCLARRPAVVVCVSEGLKDANGTLLCEYETESHTDSFGHKKLSGCGKFLEELISHRLGVKTRAVELNVTQRCSGNLQSETDRLEAIQAGTFGVEQALLGKTSVMVTFHRTAGAPYTLTLGTEDVNLICNEEKCIPREWISTDGCDITEALAAYIRPLIQGNAVPPMKDGLPDFLYLKD